MALLRNLYSDASFSERDMDVLELSWGTGKLSVPQQHLPVSQSRLKATASMALWELARRRDGLTRMSW